MKLNKKIIFPILILLVIFFISFYILDPERAGICQYNDINCGNLYGEAIAQPIFFFSLSLLITCIGLLFSREETFKSWRRFAYWAIPISVILLWIAPTTTGGGLGISFLSYTKESASWLVSGAFLLISLIIIVRKSLQAGSQK